MLAVEFLASHASFDLCSLRSNKPITAPEPDNYTTTQNDAPIALRARLIASASMVWNILERRPSSFGCSAKELHVHVPSFHFRAKSGLFPARAQHSAACYLTPCELPTIFGICVFYFADKSNCQAVDFKSLFWKIFNFVKCYFQNTD